MLVPKIKHNDWRSIQLAIEKLASIRLGPDATPIFAGLTLTGLTALRLLSSDADKQLVSSDLASWVTETANQVLVADDGDGTITLSTPQDIDIAADVQFASLTLNNTGLHLLDTNASHDLIIAPGSDLTVDRTLTITTGDAGRTVTLSGNPTLSDWFDQSVKQAASPTFANLSLGTGELTCGSINRAAGSLTLEIGGIPQVTITNTTVTYAGDVVITGTTTHDSNIIIPDNGWIGSVTTNQAIQIEADGDIVIPQMLAVTGDVQVTGNILLMTNNGGVGYSDNSPMLVFNNTNDRVEATGGLTVSLAASVAGNIESTAGELRSGVQDTTRGYCRLFGQGAAQVWGGTLYLETSADYDTAISAYILSAYEDDFIIQNGGGGNLFHIAGADNSVNVANALNVTGAITAANYTAANLLTACATNAGGLNFSAANKTLTVENNAIVSQDYSTNASPTFAGLVIADGGTIGQVAGPLITFDDSNNYLGITGCNIGIGTNTPRGALHILGRDLIMGDAVTNADSRIFFREGDPGYDNWGFTVGYSGSGNLLNIPANTFAISRHVNNANGIIVLQIPRDQPGVFFNCPLKIKEQTLTSVSTAAYGQIWVKSSTPNILMFTADDGTTFTIDVTPV